MTKYKENDVVVCRTPENNFAIYTLYKPVKIYKKWLATGADKNLYRIHEDDILDKDDRDNVLELTSYIKALSEYLFRSKVY
jgi:hypothetical protein